MSERQYKSQNRYEEKKTGVTYPIKTKQTHLQCTR